MRRIIECQVTDEYVRGSGMVVGAAGSHNDVALRLAFNPMWAGTTRSIVWKDALGGNPIVTILGTDLLVPGETEVYIVPIPAEPKAYAGDMSMTIKGAVVDGDKETSATLTARAFFTVMESDWDENAGDTQDITPTQAEQFQAQLDAIKDDISDAAKVAAGAEAAENAAALAALSAQGAANSATQANDSRLAAAGSAQAAQDAKNAVENMTVTSENVPADSKTPVVEKKFNADGSINLHFNARQGVSGVYVGNGVMPDGYNVQVDYENGVETVDFYTLAEETKINAKNAAESERAAEEARTAAEKARGEAQSYAEQAAVPAAPGVYNVILTDRITAERYALIVESGRLKLLGVSNSLDAADLTLIDSSTGVSYSVVIERGKLILEEV